jgi:hypothetical protein
MLRVTEQIIADAVTIDDTVRLTNGMLAKRVNAARLFEHGNEEAAEHAQKMARYFLEHVARFDPAAVGFFVLNGGAKLQPLFPDVFRGVTKVHSGDIGVDMPNILGDETRAFLIEDVLNTGGSTMRAIKTLMAHGIGIEFVFALIDRKIGAVKRLRSEGVNVVCVADVPAYQDRYSMDAKVGAK